MNKKKSFSWSEKCEPHKLRTREIISNHPEIRHLIGRNPYTFLVIVLCVGIQIAMSWILYDESWWFIVPCAYLIGAFACHTLFICIHECSHNLIFKNRVLNTLSGIFANLPLVFPSSVSFQKYHLKHHAFQGIEELDADMPSEWEAKLVNNSTIGKALWLLLYPIVQASRLGRMSKEIKMFDKWVILNYVVQFAFMGLIFYFWQWKAIAYLTASFFFSVGLHPLGARWIQEHFLTHDEDQETKSYYGVLNVVNLNVGYHNEHHDFPSIPWNNLPKIKQIASPYYDSLGSHKSYTRLLLRFIFDRNLSLYSRMARDNRGKTKSTSTKSPAHIE
ncbi:fatty acid desaturase [Olivibacter sp. XZL3]|uniref:fatty acid desaturase n=1 Tax=Olivibacter sp. XZL3 TaxID=1735116 RepID=UPI001065617B|nr:fatty acid desaturase [Olivibacter sp. XZL3]